MQIKARYSHLNGEEYLLVHRKALWQEVQNVIARVGVRLPYEDLKGKNNARATSIFAKRYESGVQGRLQGAPVG